MDNRSSGNNQGRVGKTQALTEDTTRLKLFFNWTFELGILLPQLVFLFCTLRLDFVQDLFFFFRQLLPFFLTDQHSIVIFIPMPEWSGVNQDNGILYECLCSDQLVVGSVVHNIDDPRFAGYTWNKMEWLDGENDECIFVIMTSLRALLG